MLLNPLKKISLGLSFSLLITGLLLCSCFRRDNSQPVDSLSPAPEAGGAGIADPVRVIGFSVEQRPLILTRLGRGRERAVILLGGIHGEETNTSELVTVLLDLYQNQPGLVPGNTTLYFLPAVNPDGLAVNRRVNSRGVDLNHNFPAADWQAEALDMSGRLVPGLGGEAPGSEPEVQAVVRLLQTVIRSAYSEMWLLSFHSACPPRGYVQPGYLQNGEPEPLSAELARQAADYADYKYLPAWVDPKGPVTGELIRYCAEQGILGMDVELPSYAGPGIVPEGKSENILAAMSRMLEKLLALPALPIRR